MSSAGTQGGAVVLTAQDISRAITRIAHEILERNRGINNVVLVGMQRGGVWIADAIKAAVERVEPGSTVGAGSIDVSMYRDD
ncbi:MAG: hypothetical protein JHD14_03185, partial [Ilumatobacteraceae bacterium]|nr:hypothetical protein [Ilumatobacteraceae bacterium]